MWIAGAVTLGAAMGAMPPAAGQGADEDASFGSRGRSCQRSDKPEHLDRDKEPRSPLGSPTMPPLRLTDEQLRQYVDALRQISPETGENLDKLMATDPEQARQAIHRLGPRLRFMVFQKVVDPEGFEIRAVEQRLQLHAAEIAQRIKQAAGDAAAGEKLKLELRPVLDQHFDARIKVMEHELLSLERRIQRLREDLAQQRTQKDKVIEDRMAYLLSDNADGKQPPR
jgi:hypothetical protein